MNRKTVKVLKQFNSARTGTVESGVMLKNIPASFADHLIKHGLAEVVAADGSNQKAEKIAPETVSEPKKKAQKKTSKSKKAAD